MKMILSFLLILTMNSCVKRKPIQRVTNEYTYEELVVIEFATRMEEQEHKYQDYHSTKK